MSADGSTRRDRPVDGLRVPPQAIQAEQAVLGGLMLGGDHRRAQAAWDDCASILEEESFYRRDHQLIWRALKHLQSKHRPLDALTVGDFLEARGLSEHAPSAYLVELAATTPSIAQIRPYAEIVADKWRLRRIIELGTTLVDAGFNPGGLESIEIIGQAQTQVAGLLQAQPSEVSPISVAMDGAFAELSDRHQRGQGMDGLPTGYPELDDILGGLVPGVHVLAGRPKHGKSTLAQNIGEYVALYEHRSVLVDILEMSEQQYAKRVIASVGHVDSTKMRRGTLDDEDWTRVSSAVRRMRGAPMFISKPGTSRVEHICAQIRRKAAELSKTKYPLGLVVLDYLQLIDITTAKGENTSVAIGRVTRALVNLTQELQVPLILISQLNRESEKDGRPKPSHLRDSGAIEADAETVTFVYRDDMNNKDSPYKGTVEVIVALNRNGGDGSFRLLFNGPQYRCENLPPDWHPLPTASASKQKRNFSKSHERAEAE